MRKFWIFLVLIVVGIFAYFAIKQYNNTNIKNDKVIVEEKEVVEQNDDENNVINEVSNTIATNSSEARISPNAVVTMKKVYLQCGHTIEEQEEVPNEVVNMNPEEVKLYYNEWKLESFTKDNVIITRTYNEKCNEHYMLKEDNGYIAIYKENNNGYEKIEQTEIYVEFLTDMDIKKLEEGINIIGRKNVNSVLEDFE